MGSFWTKYIMFELKEYRGFMFHYTEKWCKIWRKTWHEQLGKLLPECWDPFIQSRKCMSLKFTEELCIMTIKNDAKFEEELTCRFKIDIRNLTNFDPSNQTFSKIFTLLDSFWQKYIMFELKKVQKTYSWCHWWLMQNFKKYWLVLSKMTWGIWQIFTDWKIEISF